MTTTVRRLGPALCLTGLASVLVMTGGASAATASGAGPGPARASTAVSPADAERSAAAVAAEDRRLTALRTVSALSRWQGQAKKTPYRVSTSSGYTLVLTPRANPYTVDDLLSLAPQTFRPMSDGGFLLSEHIVVTAGATLHLARPGGLSLRLTSGAKGFVTIVSMGGRIEIAGEQAAPVRITSWDVAAGAPDEDLTDGRAYVRSIGGQFAADYLQASDLGFWSGRTGGLALTGTDRPNTGTISPLHGATPDPGLPSALSGVTTQPAGPLLSGQTDLGSEFAIPAADYVSSRLAHTSVDGDAFGLFVSGANGLQISASTFRNSSVGGVVLHRYVTNGAITGSTSVHNAGDGFLLDRATTGITLNEVTASDNAGSGITVSGRALSAGPSTTGSPTGSYGGNSVSNSTVERNGHFGVHVVGGFDIGVQNNHVSGSQMGVVVQGPANRISVTGNDVRSSSKHGVALLDAVTASTVTGNIIRNMATGVYVRDSAATVSGNTVTDASLHGISIVGRAGADKVAYNVLAGSGPSALDVSRASGSVAQQGNQSNGWHDTSPWYTVFNRLLHPMNALWLSIFVLVVLSALRSRRTERQVGHPYAHQMARHDRPAMPQPDVIDLRDDLVGVGAR